MGILDISCTGHCSCMSSYLGRKKLLWKQEAKHALNLWIQMEWKTTHIEICRETETDRERGCERDLEVREIETNFLRIRSKNTSRNVYPLKLLETFCVCVYALWGEFYSYILEICHLQKFKKYQFEARRCKTWVVWEKMQCIFCFKEKFCRELLEIK